MTFMVETQTSPISSVTLLQVKLFLVVQVYRSYGQVSSRIVRIAVENNQFKKQKLLPSLQMMSAIFDLE